MDAVHSPVVARCYHFFDLVFPTIGLRDYTEGLYDGDPETPYEVAQRQQHEYLLDEIGCGLGFRLLDIGCGNGTLLEAAAERGAKAVGITICPEQVGHCRKRGLDVELKSYTEVADCFAHQFDGIIANGSAEHFCQPADAAAGRQNEIYQEFFAICHRLLKPGRGRLATTTIHFHRPPSDPRILLGNPLRLGWGSIDFHYSLILAHGFGGYYPSRGQLERAAAPWFRLTREVDGTNDYHLTSEEWLRRVHRAMYLPVRRSIFGHGILLHSCGLQLRRPQC